MKILYTFTLSLLLLQIGNAQNLVFSYTVDESNPAMIEVDIFARSTDVDENLSGYTSVFYYNSAEVAYVSYQESTAQALGWSTSGNFTIANAIGSISNPNVPSVHDSRLELQQFDGDLMGSSISNVPVAVGTLIFDRTAAGNPNDGGDLFIGDTGNTDPGIAYEDAAFTGYDVVTEGDQQQSLPIELAAFELSRVNENTARLNWRTASEIAASHFTIQRSTDAKRWTDLGSVTAVGSPFSQKNYAYLDQDIPEMIRKYKAVYYRLKMVDLSGAYEFSPVKSIDFEVAKVELTLYPNPTIDVLHISSVAEVYTLQVYNGANQIIGAQDYNGAGLEVSELPAGYYTVKIATAAGTVFKQFVKMD